MQASMQLVRKLALAALLVGVLLIPELALMTASAASEDDQRRTYVVLLDEQVERVDFVLELILLYDAEVLFQYGRVFNGLAVRLLPEQAETLAGDRRVQGMTEDFQVTASAQTTPNGISAVKATENGLADIDGVDERVDVDVAVLDTGSGPHVDLNVVGGVSCQGGSYNDNNGHGTHVAGTIGALDNDYGVVGVAPGARIWSVKVLDANGSGAISAVICGIDWVTANVDVIEVANMSLGANYGAPPSRDNCGNFDSDAFIEDAMHKAICNSVAAGVTYAAAAGNNNADTRNFAPARYPEAITVSAISVNNWQRAAFSNYGQAVDVTAPGVSVLSTTPGNGYQAWNGTSMATPHAAGAAALYVTANPGATPAQVRDALIASGDSSVWYGDRDYYKEPFIDVSTFGGAPSEPEEPDEPEDPPPAVVDAEVVSVSAASSITQGGALGIAVTVKNNGSVAADIPVSISESPGGWSGSQTVNVVAGASVNVGFNWATGTATTVGSHTLTVSTTLTGDSNSANNSKSATVNVQAQSGGSGGMYVYSLNVSSRKVRTYWYLSTSVSIRQGSSAVSYAYVTVRITGPNGYAKTVTRRTSSNGYVGFSERVTRSGQYTLTVTNVSKSGATYNPALNRVTSRSVTAR